MLRPFSRSAVTPSAIPFVSSTNPLSAHTLATKLAIGTPSAPRMLPCSGASAFGLADIDEHLAAAQHLQVRQCARRDQRLRRGARGLGVVAFDGFAQREPSAR